MATLTGTVTTCNGAYRWSWITNTANGGWVPVTAPAGTAPPVGVPPTPAPPGPEQVTEFGAAVDLAEAALAYFAGKQPEQPEWYLGKLLAGARPATAGAIERAILVRNRERQAPLDTEHVRVNLRSWEVDGLVFMVEGCRRLA